MMVSCNCTFGQNEHKFKFSFSVGSGHGGSEAATFAKEHLINEIVSQKSFWSDDDQEVLNAIEEGYISTHYAMWAEQGELQITEEPIWFSFWSLVRKKR